jgi:hypothetical protein
MDNIPNSEISNTGANTTPTVDSYPTVPDRAGNQNPGFNEDGQLVDPVVAERIAHEAKEGNWARTSILEEMYRRREEDNLRLEQNIEIGRMLFEEFPNAVKKVEDPRGEEVYQAGISILDYEGMMKDPRMPDAKKEELEEKLEGLIVEAWRCEGNDKFLTPVSPLIRPGNGVFFTREGYIRTDNPEYKPTQGVTHSRVEKDSLSSLSESQKKAFFDTMAFLDEIGRISKELGLGEGVSEQQESSQPGVGDLRDMARDVKQNTGN